WDVPLKAVIDANPHLKNPNVLMTGEVVYIPKVGAEAEQEAGSAMPTEVGAGHLPIHEEVGVNVEQQATAAAPVMPEIAEETQELPAVMPQSVVTEQEETEMPFAQFKMPATEVMQPYSLQPAQDMPMTFAPNTTAQPQPFYPHLMSQPATYPANFSNVMPFQQMPAAQNNMYPFPTTLPAMDNKSLGSNAAPAETMTMPWQQTQPTQNMPMFAPQQAYQSPMAAGGPCTCQGGHSSHGGYPMGMYNMPYAMPTSAYPAQQSPHSSWSKKDSDYGDMRTGDITLAEVRSSAIEQTSKSAEAKVSISTKTRTPKKKTTERHAKKQNHPWIRP
ncbi:MAG: lysM, partial [Paenibacillus sp.]|nr:lysM [Paenibacillus sp.]